MPLAKPPMKQPNDFATADRFTAAYCEDSLSSLGNATKEPSDQIMDLAGSMYIETCYLVPDPLLSQELGSYDSYFKEKGIIDEWKN